MSQLAIRIPDALHARMREVPINWSEVVREAIEDRLAQAERERLLSAWMAQPDPQPQPAAGTAARLVREDRDE
jgi:hypothetical protein